MTRFESSLNSILHALHALHGGLLSGISDANNVLTEAVGEVGGKHSLADKGITHAPGHTERYHGTDHIGDDAKALDYAWATEKWFEKKGEPTKNRFHSNFFHRCRMVRAVLEQNPDLFEASMEVQLKSHAWDAVHDDIADTPEAYIYVDGVALCNLALHKGMKIDFEAGVIPEGLLIGA